MDDDDEQVLDNTLVDVAEFVVDPTAGVEAVVVDSVEQPCLM